MILSYIYENMAMGVQNLRYSFSFLDLIYKIMREDISEYDDKKLDLLKEKIIYNGPISLKFMQWYLSKKV